VNTICVGIAADQAVAADLPVATLAPARRQDRDLIKKFIGLENTRCLPPETATVDGGREDCHWKKGRNGDIRFDHGIKRDRS
jgi:hypothetical protein